MVWKARPEFQSSLQEDRRQRVQSAGANIKGLLESGSIKDPWDHLTRWYHQVRVRQSHLTRVGLDQVSEYWAELYRCLPSQGLWVPLLVQPVAVNNDLQEEA